VIVPEIVPQAMSAKWAKGTSGPAGDEVANLVAHARRADGFDASEDGTGRGTPLVPVQAFDAWQSDVIQYGDKTGPLDTDGHSVMAVRRLTPLECARLQGFPDMRRSCRIEVCGDSLKHHAPVGNPNHRLLSVADAVYPEHLTESVSSVEVVLPVNHPKTSKLVEVNVEIRCADGTMQLAIRECGWLERVRIADANARTFLATPIGDFARLVVATLSLLGRTTLIGSGGEPRNVNPFSHQQNGSPVVSISGAEIREHASGAESVTSVLRQYLTYTTSEVGPSSPIFDWNQQILCSCVANAIGSFIPGRIRMPTLFAIELTSESEYLDIPYRGKPAADGPKYKALGNSMAVPVMRWIGERIQRVEALV